jgi:hypothetical protein
MPELKKLKRVVIKEELVALTGKVEHAIVLNQFIYWSERVRDVDKYLKEEMERIEKFNDGSLGSPEEIKETLTKGWIYKTAADMKDECMFEKSATTMERIIKALVEKGWLDRRNNPRLKWDKTYQYRVNILKIQKDLMEIGYALEGYALPRLEGKKEEYLPNLQNEESKEHREETNLQNEEWIIQNEDSTLHFEGAIPEITLEITSDLKEEEEEDIHSELISFLISKEITLENALQFENRLLRDGLSGYTYDQVIDSIEWSLQQFLKGQCNEPYVYAVGRLQRVLDGKVTDIANKPKNKTTKKKPVRTEKLPDWFKEDTNNNPVATASRQTQEEKKQEIEDMLKRLRA